MAIKLKLLDNTVSVNISKMPKMLFKNIKKKKKKKVRRKNDKK
jgi:hypothetical protein